MRALFSSPSPRPNSKARNHGMTKMAPNWRRSIVRAVTGATCAAHFTCQGEQRDEFNFTLESVGAAARFTLKTGSTCLRRPGESPVARERSDVRADEKIIVPSGLATLSGLAGKRHLTQNNSTVTRFETKQLFFAQASRGLRASGEGAAIYLSGLTFL